MALPIETNARGLAELLQSVVNRLYLAGYTEAMTPAQWMALRFVRQANPSAATVLNFARHYGVTKGTASQTISHLVAKGLVQRTHAPEDARSRRLELTAQGARVLDKDPLNAVTKTLEELDPSLRLAFAQGLHKLLAATLSTRE